MYHIVYQSYHKYGLLQVQLSQILLVITFELLCVHKLNLTFHMTWKSPVTVMSAVQYSTNDD